MTAGRVDGGWSFALHALADVSSFVHQLLPAGARYDTILSRKTKMSHTGALAALGVGCHVCRALHKKVCTHPIVVVCEAPKRLTN